MNLRYGKNKKSSEIKAHHYIIHFAPKDRDDNGLTSKQVQALGMEFAQKNFPGHQTLVCPPRRAQLSRQYSRTHCNQQCSYI
ncbi:hypothetical protein [Mediterraneibacter glycyrrhizinilyticus]|uniref:hypothetical protein n=1 Tax=Mediterraneibacter glycyrrhizinilyticus TaxID=342942 RepID=UPI0036F3EB10